MALLTTRENPATITSLAARIKARAPTYLLYLREEPSWIVMFFFARTVLGRRIERFVRRAGFRKAIAAPDSVLENLDPQNVADDLVKDGVALGLQLPAPMVERIVAFSQVTPCYSRDRQEYGFVPEDVEAANRERERDVIAAYYFEAVKQSPDIMALTRDPGLLSVANAYIGSKPVLIRIRMWWSFPAARVSDADLHAAAQEKYHFDLNGWRTLKFFFYLTPTSEKSGAHRCIPGSHLERPLKHQLTPTVGRATAELENFYGKDRFLTITGQAGSGFAEDPFLLHTGSLCEDKPRLILELEYAAAPVSPSYTYGRFG